MKEGSKHERALVDSMVEQADVLPAELSFLRDLEITTGNVFLAPRVNARSAASGAEVFFVRRGGSVSHFEGCGHGCFGQSWARGGIPLRSCFGGGGGRLLLVGARRLAIRQTDPKLSS